METWPKARVGQHFGATSNFASSVRGDTTHERFIYAKSSMVLPDHPMRRPLSAAFTAAKTSENEATRERIEARPHGRRFEAAEQFRDRIAAAREAQAVDEEARQKALAQRQGREFKTSDGNPLVAAWASDDSSSSCNSDDSSSGEASSGLEGHSPREQGAASKGQSRNHKHKSHDRGNAPNEARHKAMNLEGHLELGALTLRTEASDAAAADVVPHRCHGGARVAAALAAHEAHARAAAITEQQLAGAWPHGVPRRIAHDMRAAGVELPVAGFGEPSSSAPLAAAFSKR